MSYLEITEQFYKLKEPTVLNTATKIIRMVSKTRILITIGMSVKDRYLEAEVLWR